MFRVENAQTIWLFELFFFLVEGSLNLIFFIPHICHQAETINNIGTLQHPMRMVARKLSVSTIEVAPTENPEILLSRCK